MSSVFPKIRLCYWAFTLIVMGAWVIAVTPSFLKSMLAPLIRAPHRNRRVPFLKNANFIVFGENSFELSQLGKGGRSALRLLLLPALLLYALSCL